MKRKILWMLASIVIPLGTQAQEQDDIDLGLLNHASVAVGVGTTGITADLSLPVSPFVVVRGGVDILPFKYSTNLDIDYRDKLANAVLPNDVKVEGKLSMTSGHVLADFFPSKQSAFRLTAGLYLGGEKVAEAYNKEDGALMAVTAYNRAMPESKKAGYPLGDYFLMPDENGNVHADITVNKLRPYVGIGFGRPVPTNSRVAFNFDLGVQFWGKPTVTCQNQKLQDEDMKGDDGGLVKYISMASIWPVLNIRVALLLF